MASARIPTFRQLRPPTTGFCGPGRILHTTPNTTARHSRTHIPSPPTFIDSAFFNLWKRFQTTAKHFARRIPTPNVGYTRPYAVARGLAPGFIAYNQMAHAVLSTEGTTTIGVGVGPVNGKADRTGKLVKFLMENCVVDFGKLGRSSGKKIDGGVSILTLGNTNASANDIKLFALRRFKRNFYRQQRQYATSSEQQSQTQSWRVARAELLDSATGFWARLRLRIRLFLMGGKRPWGADDIFAMFSWIFMGHTVFLFVGTTTFLSILLGVANSLQFQSYLAGAISDYVTNETGFKVTFESAIVPRWKEGVIRLENVSVVCNDKTWIELKNKERIANGLEPYPEGELDVNWTYWDLTFRHIDVTLSLWRWLDGKGLIKECTIKGIRGEIDRRHVIWPENYIPTRRTPQPGDYEIAKFVIEDLLITIRNPKFRPYTVSIFNAEIPLLRKQWLLYDVMRADVMNGLFDNCLFSVHRPQLVRPGVEEGIWGKMSHLKLNGLPIDHLNAGVTGPFGWITRGFLDIDLQLLFPQTNDDNLLNILKDELRDVTEEALDKIEEVIVKHPEVEGRTGSGIVRHYRDRHSREDVDEGHDLVGGVGNGDGDEKKKSTKPSSLVMVWSVRLHDLKASVPIISPHISYLHSALIRPIVAYLNAVKTTLQIKFSATSSLSNFDGAWTVYQASLVDILSEEVGRAVTRLVVEERRRQLRRVTVWTVGSVLREVGRLVEYVKGVRGWREWVGGEERVFV